MTGFPWAMYEKLCTKSYVRDKEGYVRKHIFLWGGGWKDEELSFRHVSLGSLVQIGGVVKLKI